jgi:hypothetical protein
MSVRVTGRVAAATKSPGNRHPVVPDDDFAIRRRSGIRSRPPAVPVDRRGIVRPHHVGEGAHEETGATIRRRRGEPA